MKYTPGSQLILVPALSRTYLLVETPDQPDDCKIPVLESGHLFETMLHKLTDETIKDPELQQLHKVATDGCSQTKDETPLETRLYRKYTDEMSFMRG